MFPCGSLETAVAVRSGAAVNTAFFVVIVLMKSIGTFWTARAIVVGAAMYAFSG